ncbi:MULTISPECIES: inorganic phosphate transporter [unclassified Curtobacterium]|uniref:inorganic phosphate transporter n=1 Tax=unclassified Curtobacterium TaxID=257496 RepID=UPI000DAA4668|nr:MULTISPECIES: inorganic phosphate transporter [unclassified Curtobacterium]PZE24979.1 inorganic phosphate transporter [Curtobacterium sp. MCBD17_028]PZE73634.1 inorganic phosphate transporter [Curtobacterium sp. MCBD17_019]PZF56832.1 inorganic phosphate transporter [Curtobacterium sp. MCBD17_034]PZM33788.1 inorganic phosphate transporter [Curtobacterium sp. MCBD17_031]WIE55465.1 inorganic phosphate transporter [Curtobacterium sp. MCBD17_003]
MDLTLIVVLVIALALFFDFTNGFHDTANAMATPIATGAMKPTVAVSVAAVLNLVGAFLSTEVATSISHGLINEGPGGVAITPAMIFAGLIGAVTWNMITWLRGLPSSSSHALFGGLIGAAIVGAGFGSVNYASLLTVVIIPAVLSPVIASVVAFLATRIAYTVTRRKGAPNERGGFRIGQIFTSSMVSLAHGTNDAQKTMGVITLTLIAGGFQRSGSGPELWVIVACAMAIALGTYTGGWRIIRTLGSGLTDIRATQGFAAEASTAATILASSHVGFALSTTQVSSGSIIGAGLGRRGSKIQWSTAGKIVIAWFITLPASAAVGAVASAIARIGTAGLVVDAVLGAVIIAGLFLWSRRNPVEQAAAIEVDVAANSVLTRKQRRDLQRRKRAEEVAARRVALSREKTLRRMAARRGGRR